MMKYFFRFPYYGNIYVFVECICLFALVEIYIFFGQKNFLSKIMVRIFRSHYSVSKLILLGLFQAMSVSLFLCQFMSFI